MPQESPSQKANSSSRKDQQPVGVSDAKGFGTEVGSMRYTRRKEDGEEGRPRGSKRGEIEDKQGRPRGSERWEIKDKPSEIVITRAWRRDCGDGDVHRSSTMTRMIDRLVN